MEEVTLQALLEAGCHFGHKSERWHPKAAEFIYTEKDGIHIIDLAKTKAGLDAASEFIKRTVSHGDEVLFIATKRQAKGVVREEVEAVGAPYLVERWIGGFLTNWDSIHKNIEKVNRLAKEKEAGDWKKFPKHEQSKLSRYLERLKIFYGGVLLLAHSPAVIVVVDIKHEDSAVREAHRRNIPVIAIVDTNTNASGIEYPIPANDDAVGSIQIIAHVLAQAYKEGKDVRRKEIEPKQEAKKGENEVEEKIVENEIPKVQKKESIKKDGKKKSGKLK